MRILSFWLLATVLACGGGGVWSSGDSDRFEYTDPAETTPMEDAHGTPAIDVDRVVMKSDGNAAVVVLHLKDTLANYLKVVNEGDGFMCDPAWIYFDTDDDPETGGLATAELPGFEYEARVVSSLENGQPSTFYALDKFEQGESSFDMLDRYSEMGHESLQARQREWNQSKSQITVQDSTVTIRFPYAIIGVVSGDTIRIRMREHHRGPYPAEQFFPDATLTLK